MRRSLARCSRTRRPESEAARRTSGVVFDGDRSGGALVKTKDEPKGKRAFIGGFDNAWEGIVRAVRTQRNMRFHALAAVAVVVAGIVFRVGVVEFAVLFLAIVLVMAMELVNTAVEACVDLVSPDFHPLAKIAKDAAAGAVFIASIGAAIIGAVIFVPRAVELGANFFGAS